VTYPFDDNSAWRRLRQLTRLDLLDFGRLREFGFHVGLLCECLTRIIAEDPNPKISACVAENRAISSHHAAQADGAYPGLPSPLRWPPLFHSSSAGLDRVLRERHSFAMNRRVSNERGRAVLLRLLDYWDVCVATAIAVVGMFLVAVLKLSPLLLIIIGLAFFACVTAQVICVRNASDATDDDWRVRQPWLDDGPKLLEFTSPARRRRDMTGRSAKPLTTSLSFFKS
jgi:hypothetical protein